MTATTITALCVLADHIDRHQLDDGAIMRAGVDDRAAIDVQVHAAPDIDMRALLTAWATSIDKPRITAKPVQDSFHVHITGTVATFPISVVCVATGVRANHVRAALGIPAVPALPTGDALLDALAARQVA